jgi:multiple antibiotic resistance protein
MIELILATAAAIFSIVNPLGAIPLYLSLTNTYSQVHRNETALHVSIYTVGILMVFFWLGIYLLNFFGIEIHALRIAGGLILLNSGFGLMSGNMEGSRAISKKVKEEAEHKEDISFTPMAMPMLAGPGSISFLITKYAENKAIESKLSISLSIIIVGLIIFIILKYSSLFYRILGNAGLKALSRIMGFLVMAIGMQYMIIGIVRLVETLL